MSFKRIVGIAFWFALTSASFGQQKSESQTNKGPSQTPAEITTVRSYPGGNRPASRVVRTRTESGGREIITESTEVPGTDGRFETLVKTVTESVGIGSDSVMIKREVFGKGAYGQDSLVETSAAERENLPDGTSRTITNTWVPDLNGHLKLSSRRIEETKSASPDVRQTQMTLYTPTVNEPLSETERIHQIERRLGPNLVQTESQVDFRDANGRWQTTEMRNKEVRTINSAEVVEELTTRSLDVVGELAISDRTITRRRSTGNSSDEVITEVYSPYVIGLVRDRDSSLELDRRVGVTTTRTTGGGSQSIIETEERFPSVLNGPIRVVARTVETVQQSGPGQWETQRQTFWLDGSGRLVPSVVDQEETKDK